MASLYTVFWRDIPAQVIVRQGRASAKRQLSERFQEAVDAAAMHSGAHGTDAYLADWRRNEMPAPGTDLEAEADAAVAEIEVAYDEARLQSLIRNDGREET